MKRKGKLLLIVSLFVLSSLTGCFFDKKENEKTVEEVVDNQRWGISEITYYDEEYNSNLAFTAYGTYSYQIIDREEFNSIFESSKKNNPSLREDEYIYNNLITSVNEYFSGLNISKLSDLTIDKSKFEEEEFNALHEEEGYVITNFKISAINYTDDSEKFIIDYINNRKKSN